MTARMAQYGVGHGHASGKMLAMRQNAAVEVVGIFEPSAAKRARVEGPVRIPGAGVLRPGPHVDALERGGDGGDCHP